MDSGTVENHLSLPTIHLSGAEPADKHFKVYENA
jgi:hypothetical protein